MRSIKNQPNPNLRRYWKEKITEIKAYIAAHKYDIVIPPALQFEDSEDEMMQEAKKAAEAEKIKQAEMRKRPKASDHFSTKKS